MAPISLRKLLNDNLPEFGMKAPEFATIIQDVLEDAPLELDNDDLLNWWKQLGIAKTMPFHSFLGWMWTKNLIEYKQFEKINKIFDPVVSQSWTVPIEITTGLDSPLMEGGFLSHDFSIFKYRFHPSSHRISVTFNTSPSSDNNSENLDLVLDFLSFMLDRYNFGYLGFRQLLSHKSHFVERKTVAIGRGPEIRQDMLDFDFSEVEKVLSHLASQEDKQDSFSALNLLRIRHRAILDSSLESKLITLWAGIEELWGDEAYQNSLLSQNEYSKIKRAIKPIVYTSKAPQKYNLIVQLIGKLKIKTKNERIIDELRKLECSGQWDDIPKTIGSIFSYRSKFAHGKSLEVGDLDLVRSYISYLIAVFDELISDKLLQQRIILNPPRSQ